MTNSNLSSHTLSNNRSTNLELLRIVSMLLIIAHHFSYHGNFNFNTNTISANRLWIEFIEIGGKIGVNIFVLISGYFLIASPHIKIQKLLKLWLQMFFYSLIFYFIFTISGKNDFSIRSLIEAIFPTTFIQWGFASTYLIMYIFSPYLNKLLNQLSQKDYKKMLILMLICWCIIPTITNKFLESNNLIWYFFLYSIAGYIRLWGDHFSKRATLFITVALLFIGLTFIYVTLIDIIGIHHSDILKYQTYFYDAQKLNILIISVCLFLFFNAIDIKQSKFINTVSSTTFGIYLIHENHYVRNLLWNKIVPTEIYTATNCIILQSILLTLVIFTFCSIIEFLRIRLIEKQYLNTLYNISLKISQGIQNLFH